MYKLVIVVSLLAFGATRSFSQAIKKYEIAGTAVGFPDSTRIYIGDPISGSLVLIDSALIIKNKFHFSGSMPGDAMRIQLNVGSDYKYFWLEASKITVSVKKGNFRSAVIMGSKAQREEEQLDAVLKTSNNEKQDNIRFIRNHPNSIVGANILSTYATTWGKDTVAPLYKGLSAKIKNSIYGKSVKNFISFNKDVKIGDSYVDFTEQDPEGKDISLSDFHDKVVLLEFWGSRCGPCREENPALVSYYNEFRDRGFEILGVALDSEKQLWLDAIREDQLPWPNVTDLKGWQNKAAFIYGVGFIPNNFLIDRNGKIIATNLRTDDLRNKLVEIFK